MKQVFRKRFHQLFHFVLRTDYHKFNYYSNHDSTIMAVLIALGLVDDNSYHWPPFASTVTFELWRDYSVESSAVSDYSGYYVRVLYCEKVRFVSLHHIFISTWI